MKRYLLFTMLCLITLLQTGCSGRSEEASIKADGGYEVRISADNQWDNQRPYYCELWLNGRQLRKPHFFEASEATKYKLVEAKDDAGFKIIDAATGLTLILVNRKTGDAWPWTGDSESSEQAEKRRSQIESLFKDTEHVEASNGG